MATRRPETRRKVPNYFGDCAELAIVWNHTGWAVRFWCAQLKRWDWENLQTERIGEKLEAEAKAAAVKLMRASVARWEEELAKVAAKAKHLSLAASRIESGVADWSSL
jgi:hypothetical protein